MGEEKRVLQFGGLCGLSAGILVILSQVVVLVRGAPATAEETLVRYVEGTEVGRLHNGLFLVAAILAIPLVVALYRSLRKTGTASASFGGALGILGSVLLAASAAFFLVAVPTLAGLYADAPTPQDRTTVVYLSQATLGVSQTLLFVANLFAAIGIVSLGVAMLGDPGFGKGFGGSSMVLGLATGAGVLVPLAIWALVVFLLLFGWKVYSLSRSPGPA